MLSALPNHNLHIASKEKTTRDSSVTARKVANTDLNMELRANQKEPLKLNKKSLLQQFKS